MQQTLSEELDKTLIIDYTDNLDTFFQKLFDIGIKILTDRYLKNYKIEFQNIQDLDLLILCNYIKNTYLNTNSFLNLFDNLLLVLLYQKEVLLLNTKNKNESFYSELNRLNFVLDKYSNYRGLIKNKILKHNISPNSFMPKLYGGINRLVVSLTHSCQLRCRYCRVRKFKGEMTENVLFKAIDLLFTSFKKDLQLQFFGGEPLLKYNLIKRGIKYANVLNKKYKKNLTYILTTNGIALSKEKLSYFKKLNFLLEFSFDCKTQLKNRPSKDGTDYYPLIFKNLKWMTKLNIHYCVISVVTPDTVSSTFSNFKYLINLGIRKIQINYSLGVFWNKSKIKCLISEIDRIVKFIEKNKFLGIEFINYNGNRREPVALNAELIVDYDGIIYLEAGLSLEQNFLKMKNDFFIADSKKVTDINTYSPTRFNTFYSLSKIYGSSKNEKLRRIIMNNINLGIILNRYFLKKRLMHCENNRTAF